MTTAPKTIRRRKGWPKWAKWYAKDADGGTFLFEKEPLIGGTTWYEPSFHGKLDEIEINRPCKSWQQSLRRILP